MRINMKKNGGFTFVFTADEKTLGIDMLQGLKAEDEETQAAIIQAIHQIHMVGVAPDADDTIH